MGNLGGVIVIKLQKMFTLIELIVVIVVIGILATVVIPNINNWQEEARTAGIVSNLKNIQTGIDMYSLENHGALPGLYIPTEIKPTPIDFGKLKPEHLRSVPKSKEIKYWLDFSGKTWASSLDSPVISLTDLNGEEIEVSWEKNGSDFYRVYRLENYSGSEGKVVGSAKQASLALEQEGIETSFIGKKNTVYVVSSIDANGLESAPAGKGYEPYPTNEEDGDLVKDSVNPASQPIQTEVPAGWIGIYTIEDLDEMRNNYKGSYILMNDLDFKDDKDYEDLSNKAKWSSGLGWSPVGVYSDTTKFEGVFDGNGLSIDNLYINRSDRHLGLFGSTGVASIKNIELKNAYVSSSDSSSHSGLLIGYATGTNISNVEVHGHLHGQSAGQQLGGVAGLLSEGIITYSKSIVNIDGISNLSGSLVGYAYPNAQIYDSYSTGTVQNATYSGGLAGVVKASSVARTYSTTKVSGTYSGGLIGNMGTTSVRDSFWDMEISGASTSSGGVGKTTEDMKKQITYTGWDFENVWSIVEGSEYPKLNWEK